MNGENEGGLLQALRFIFLAIPGVFLLIFGVIEVIAYIATKKGSIPIIYALLLLFLGYVLVLIGLKEKQITTKKRRFLWAIPILILIPIFIGAVFFSSILVKFGVGGLLGFLLLWVLISGYLKNKSLRESGE